MTTSTLGGDAVVGPLPEPDVVLVTTDAGRVARDTEFAAFMAEAAPALARTAWLLCGDTHRAEELVQQALVRTYLAWPAARERDPLAYARRVLANQRIDTWRKSRREQLTAPDDLPDGTVGSAAELHAERDRLVRALASLSARQRRVVVLRHLVGLSEREVADDLGVSLGTVKSTASRGIARLRDLLGEVAAPDLPAPATVAAVGPEHRQAPGPQAAPATLSPAASSGTAPSSRRDDA